MRIETGTKVQWIGHKFNPITVTDVFAELRNGNWVIMIETNHDGFPGPMTLDVFLRNILGSSELPV